MSTARDIINKAGRVAKILTKGKNFDADELVDGLETLNDMIALWSTDTGLVFALIQETFNFTGGVADYTIGVGGDFDTVRPNKIEQAFFREGSTTDHNITVIDEDKFNEAITTKTVSGFPFWVKMNNAFPLAKLTFYPVPQSNFQLHLLSEKELGSFLINDDIILPPGWKMTLIYNLSILLAPQFSKQIDPEVRRIADESSKGIKRATGKIKSFAWGPTTQVHNTVYTGFNN